MDHMKKKNLSQQKLRYLPENDRFYWDTMTGTKSSNDTLILRQNVEINSYDHFSYGPATYFFGNEIVDHVDWKRHCAITKKNVSEFKVISTICYGLHNDHWCNSSFIRPLLRLMMSFSFKKKLSVITEVLFFCEMCRSASCQQTMRHWGDDFERTSAFHVD